VLSQSCFRACPFQNYPRALPPSGLGSFVGIIGMLRCDDSESTAGWQLRDDTIGYHHSDLRYRTRYPTLWPPLVSSHVHARADASHVCPTVEQCPLPLITNTTPQLLSHGTIRKVSAKGSGTTEGGGGVSQRWWQTCSERLVGGNRIRQVKRRLRLVGDRDVLARNLCCQH